MSGPKPTVQRPRRSQVEVVRQETLPRGRQRASLAEVRYQSLRAVATLPWTSLSLTHLSPAVRQALQEATRQDRAFLIGMVMRGLAYEVAINTLMRLYLRKQRRLLSNWAQEIPALAKATLSTSVPGTEWSGWCWYC